MDKSGRNRIKLILKTFKGIVVVFFEEFWVVAILVDQPPFGVTSELVADKNFNLLDV